MTNNGPTYTEANGLSLDTLGWNVVSNGGARWTGPAKAGEDIKVPFKRGRIPTKKVRESKPYSIAMVVSPLTADGTRSLTLTEEQQFSLNIRTILNAVEAEGLIPLTKRWWSGTNVMAATAAAEFIDSGGPGTDDMQSFDLMLNFMLADPYFYTSSVAEPVDGSVTVLGEAPTDHIVLTLNGGANPRVTFPDNNWVQFNGVPSAPVTIDCRAGQATMGGQYVNGLISRNRLHPEWPVLYPGVKAVSLSGGGTATISYDPAYR